MSDGHKNENPPGLTRGVRGDLPDLVLAPVQSPRYLVSQVARPQSLYFLYRFPQWRPNRDRPAVARSGGANHQAETVMTRGQVVHGHVGTRASCPIPRLSAYRGVPAWPWCRAAGPNTRSIPQGDLANRRVSCDSLPDSPTLRGHSDGSLNGIRTRVWSWSRFRQAFQMTPSRSTSENST